MNIKSVLSKSVAAQPDEPAIGNRYLVPVAATGADWAGKDGRIAIYTAAGWFFATLPVGALLLVEDEDEYYYRNTLGSWVLAIASRPVPLTSIIGAGASFIIKVENQTTNAPPASPSAGVAYVIGPSPTGAWAGQAGKLAMCLVGGAFTIISPVAGDQVYDKSLKITATFTGTGWTSSAGIWVGGNGNFIADPGTIAFSGSTTYSYSASTAPTSGVAQLFDGETLAYAAKRSGATLRFHYSADAAYLDVTGAGAGPGTVGDFVIALYRDSETNAIDWQRVNVAGAGNAHLDHWFEVTAPGTASYTYKIGLSVKYDDSTHWTAPNTVKRRTFRVEEAA
jgi:hypothetical protein